MILTILMVIAQTQPMIDGGELSSNSVVINEFMATPLSSCTETDGEWIEFYNNTNDWINLSGWILQNNCGQKIVLSTYLLPPGSYFVLAACGDELLNGGITPDCVYSNFIIHDSGSITLSSSSRTVIDEIDYDSGWPIQEGVSCERINPGWVSNVASTWDFATLFYGNGDIGTPGSQNSVYENSFAQNSWAFIKAFVE